MDQSLQSPSPPVQVTVPVGGDKGGSGKGGDDGTGGDEKGGMRGGGGWAGGLLLMLSSSSRLTTFDVCVGSSAEPRASANSASANSARAPKTRRAVLISSNFPRLPAQSMPPSWGYRPGGLAWGDTETAAERRYQGTPGTGYRQVQFR